FNVNDYPMPVLGEGLQRVLERLVMQNQKLTEVAAETTNLNLSPVNAYSFHKLLEQTHFTAHLRVQMSVHVVRVERRPICRAEPFPFLDIIARHNVHSGLVDHCLKVRVLRKPLNLLRASCGLS